MADNPFVKQMTATFVQPKIQGGRVAIVVLELVVKRQEPDYCVHGKTRCHRCDKWCWLGSETHDAVLSGTMPLCIACANEVVPRDRHEPSGRLNDHRRADGPHE